jgi:hypothetical protein
MIFLKLNLENNILAKIIKAFHKNPNVILTDSIVSISAK